MSASVLRFPALGNTAPKPSPLAAPVPALDTFDAENSKALHSILETALEKAKILITLTHQDRELARLAGVEGISVELGALVDSERFIRLQDALAEAARLDEGTTLTHEGLAKLHRLEALVAEGTETLGRSSGSTKTLSGSAIGHSSSVDLVAWGAVMLAGAVALTIVLAIIGKSESQVPKIGMVR